jgi:hypothetical protein
MIRCASGLAEAGALFAAVKDASRRLRRSPAAILDRRCARRAGIAAGRDGEAALSRTEKHSLSNHGHPKLLNLTQTTE